MLLEISCCLVMPFLVLRLLAVDETLVAVRVHALNLVLTGSLAFAGFVLSQ